MSECKSCGASFDWAVDPLGQRIPVDRGGRTDGNVAVRTEASGKLRVRYLKRGDLSTTGERRTASHFATCPDAQAWRDRGRARDQAEARGAEAAYKVLGMDDD